MHLYTTNSHVHTVAAVLRNNSVNRFCNIVAFWINFSLIMATLKFVGHKNCFETLFYQNIYVIIEPGSVWTTFVQSTHYSHFLQEQVGGRGNLWFSSKWDCSWVRVCKFNPPLFILLDQILLRLRLLVKF